MTEEEEDLNRLLNATLELAAQVAEQRGSSLGEPAIGAAIAKAIRSGKSNAEFLARVNSNF